MTARVAINERFEISGEWFVPEQETRLSGTLSWTNGRARLALGGAFSPLHGEIHGDDSANYPLIHGIGSNGRAYTVIDGLQSNVSMNISAGRLTQTETITSSIVVCGALASKASLYSKFRMRLPGLQMWLSRNGASWTIHEKTADTPSAMSYKFDGLETETFVISAIDAELGWEIERVFAGDMNTDFSIKTAGFLLISPKLPQTYEWFFEQMTTATTLLSFLAGDSMAPDHLEGFLDDGTGVEIYVALREPKCCHLKDSHGFYMLRPAMGVAFDVVFSKWFELYDSILMPSQLARSIFNSEELWLHVEFLSLMQALEGFHRATMSGLYCTEAEYEEVEAVLVNSIPHHVQQDHRAALKSKIRYGNEISLRRRLNDLANRLELSLRKFIFGGNGTVPQTWVDTRNYYTHWDEAARDNVLDGAEMVYSNLRMKHWLRALYLDLVGVPQAAIAQSLQNTSRDSQFLIQINNAAFRRENPGVATTPLMSITEVKDENGDGQDLRNDGIKPER